MARADGLAARRNDVLLPRFTENVKADDPKRGVRARITRCTKSAPVEMSRRRRMKLNGTARARGHRSAPRADNPNSGVKDLEPLQRLRRMRRPRAEGER